MSTTTETVTTEKTKEDVAETTTTADKDKTTTTEAAAATTTAEVKTDAATKTANDTPKTEEKKDAPIAFQLKKSDGSLVDAAATKTIEDFAKSNNLSNEQAQAIYTRENAAVTAFEAEQVNQYNQRKAQWVEEAKKDPDMGGEHFSQNVQAAHLALKKFATPEFTKLLDETGFGNHPQLLKVFFNIHKASQDDKFVKSGNQQPGRKSNSEVFYPKQGE